MVREFVAVTYFKSHCLSCTYMYERRGIHRPKTGHGVFDPSPSASIYLQTLVVHNAMPNSRSCMLLPLFSSPFTAFLALLHMYMKKLDHGDSGC